MKVRRGASSESKVEQNMTAMIDVVFQLLTFFVMSFKVATEEGDFSIKMPLNAASRAAPTDEAEVPPLKLRMTAGGDGALTSMRLNSTQLPVGETGWTALRERVIDLVKTGGPGSGASDAEVELDCDYNLKYNYVIEAITAVSGYPAGNGAIVKLVEKVKFSAPKGGPK